MEDLEVRWRESDRRSRERRAAGAIRPARRRLARAGFVLVAIAGLAVPIALLRPGGTEAGTPEAAPRGASEMALFADLGFDRPDRGKREPMAERRPKAVPSESAWHDAERYAEARGGLVSFASIDSRGRLRGHDEDRRYSSASVVKAMVLAAELQRLAEDGAEIDSATDSLLTAMITASDNEAADAVYARVGDAGLLEVARRAGMTGFTIAGYWGNAQITAGDMARFFGDLDHALPNRHEEYGQELLGSVIASQSWGIPAATGDRWAARFKGGWLPDHALVHQAAELRERGGPRELSLAILTDEQPSHDYGVETLEGVAARLLEE